jgi:glycosyltransferase involved in cell wall biosynthesis
MPSDRIKVLKFLTHFAVGGTERQFVYTATGLDRSRFDITVGCTARIGPFMKDIRALDLPIWEYRINSLYSYKTVRSQLKFVRDLRREQIQVVHAYGFYPNLFAIWPAALGTRSVTIASVRDMGVFTDRHKLKSLGQATACRLADCVIANSYAVRDWLRTQGLGLHDIQVVPNGIKMPTPRRSDEPSPIREEFKIDAKCPLIAVVARLVRTKGLEYFLEAAASIVSRYPSVRFLIVGESKIEPSYRRELEQRAKNLNLTGHLFFTGQRNDVPQIMREIDISVLPSLSESFSNTLLESMANGLPVVATSVGGNPEVITDGDNGILVPPADATALSRGMAQLLDSPDLARRLGLAAREKVAKEYSLDCLLRRTEDLYVTLLERHRRHSSRSAAGTVHVQG